MENKISATLTTEAQAAIANALATIEKNLPFLINLTAQGRQILPKMGDKSMAFVYKAYDYAKQNPSIAPAFFNMAELEKDVALVASLNRVLKPLAQLSEKIEDTSLLAGSEAYTASLVFYNAVKGAAKAGVPGMKSMYDDMQVRFPGRNKLSGANPTDSN